jgi:hypothetical protein
MYFIETSERFEQNRQAIEEKSGSLDAALRGVYFVLERDPHRGQRTLAGSLLAIKTRAFLGLLPLAIYYDVDDAEGVVTLEAIIVTEPDPFG